MQHLLRQNVAAGGLYLILGLFVVFVLIPIGVDEPSNVQYPPLAPAYWPRIICVGLAVLGAAILARSFVQMRKETGAVSASGATVSDRTPWRSLLVIGLGFALYAILETLGFVLATAIALVVLMVVADERRPHIVLPVAVGVPFALYFFFTKAANIPIPSGILEPILVGG
ncbi:MAG: tripartite tricarboxylate transporter TctB family protein [Methyloligellaceae bacterium]